MSLEISVSVTAAVLTVIGTAVTVWQAWQVRTYRNQIKIDVRKINISGVVERLKRAQDDIRLLPTNVNNVQRGIKPNEVIESIRGHFDFVLGQLHAGGPEGDIRAKLSEAQDHLNSYQESWNAGRPDANEAFSLQASVQDAVSSSNSRVFELEGKA